MSQTLSARFPSCPKAEAGYLLAAFVAAHALETREFRVRSSSNEVSIDFSYHPCFSDLGKLVYSKNLKTPSETDQRLIIAIRSGLVAGAPRVDLESWDGNQGNRIKFSSDSAKKETLGRAPWKSGDSGCRITIRFRTGLNRKIFNAGSDETLSSIQSSFASRSKFCGIPILLDGTKINTPFELGEGLLQATVGSQSKDELRIPTVNCKADIQRTKDGSGSYHAHFIYGGEKEQNYILSKGLLFQIELPLAEDLGFSGMIVCDDLKLDTELEKILEDTKFDDLLNEVESDLLGFAADLVDVIDDLEDEAVESVLDSLDLVVETHRSSGENDVALEVLTRLVDVKNIPDDIRASYLTHMARSYERSKHDETSFEYYGRALDYWGRIPSEEQDLELVATALLGAARLMSYYDNEPETAMQYAQNALDLRRSVGGENDLEEAEAAELLAGLYAKHRRYPHKQFLEIENLLKISLASYQIHYGQTHDKVATVLTDLGTFCQDQGNLELAETHILRALAIKEKLFGSKDQSVGKLFDRLGALFEASGEIRKAGQYYGRALEVREHTLSSDDKEISERLNSLVILYRVYGFFEKAEPLFLRLLNMDSEANSKKENTTDDLCSLALFYQTQSKYKKAEVLFTRALELVSELHGEEPHQDTAWVHGLVGRFFGEQYLFKKAESHLFKALELTEQLLGEEHPDLIACLDALTLHFRLQQRFTEAMPWAERALSVAENFYGAHHPYVVTALNSFGELLTHSGQPAGAGPIYLAAYEIQKTGENSTNQTPRTIPKTELSRATLVRAEAEELEWKASTLAKEYSSFAEAESCYLRALFTREQNLGANHPDNATTLGLLADLYRNHRRYEGAETLYRRALKLRKANLGEGHPACCRSLSKLTELLLLQQEHEKAKPLLEEWLVIVERTLGRNHAERAEILVRAGRVCEALGSIKKSRALLQQAVKIRHKVFGTEHPSFAVTLAELLRLEEKPAQAAELYDFVVVSLEKNLVDNDPLFIPIFENYSKVLLAIGEEGKAATFETRAVVLRAHHGLDFGSME